MALAAITGSVEGKIPKPLKKLLKKISDDAQDSLLVADAKLGSSIKVKKNNYLIYVIHFMYFFPNKTILRKNLISIVLAIPMFKI